MTQNRSSAVMQQRSEPHDSLDDFPTPPWATRALCEWINEKVPGPRIDTLTARDPAANRGHMVRPLREYFAEVEGSDVHDYGAGFPVFDFVGMEILPPVDWTITNPPFKLAEDFITRAVCTSRVGFAVLVRAAFLEGVGRYQRLFSVLPPLAFLPFTERVVMHKGKLTATGSTATAYCWLVWVKHHGSFVNWGPTETHWIPPCRKRLERGEDYEDAGQEVMF